jgi:hypothetical protein
MYKKQIEVKLNGLSQLGVDTLNEYYKHNIERGLCNVFRVGDNEGGIKNKRFKNSNLFYRDGLDNYLCNITCTQLLLDENGEQSIYSGGYFSLQIKHFNYEIYEVEVVETLRKITL